MRNLYLQKLTQYIQKFHFLRITTYFYVILSIIKIINTFAQNLKHLILVNELVKIVSCKY